MIPVVSASEYRRVDQAYEGDLIAAMDRAGYAVYLAAVRAGARYGARVVVLAGPGNNGGDGYVAARYLRRRGVDVVVHALAEPKTPEARDAREKADAAGVRIVELGNVIPCDIVVDALFGGGVRRGLPDFVRDWIGVDAPVVSVDFPTGLDPDSGRVSGHAAFRAVETVTFGSIKTGHVCGAGPDHCGRVSVAQIGIEGGRPSMYIAEEADAAKPPRVRRAHKWSAGAVMVVGGSEGLVGASVFAGRSALRFGAGVAVVVSPRADLVHTVAPELPVLDHDTALERLDRFDVVVAGPGLAEGDKEMARPIIGKASKVVLDAGALDPSMLDAARQGEADVVVTPHDGEFGRIAGVPAGIFATRALAVRAGITVLRKGNPTMVSDGGLPVLVRTGGPELASIGTGDVLAGMLGALWARGLEPATAAVSAAYWHGEAASRLARTGTVTADVLADEVGHYAW